jgi:hypothetical protein
MRTYLLASMLSLMLCFFSTNLFAQCDCADCNCSDSQTVTELSTVTVTTTTLQPTPAPVLTLLNRVREVRPLRSVLLNTAPVRTVLQRSTNRVRLTLSRVRNLCSR